MASEPQQITQSSSLAAAQPAYVLRGHTAQIHAVHFIRQNLRLLSGDADGWVVLWSLPIKRPVAVWRAHNGSILGLRDWGEDRIITHGRDNKLHIWQLGAEHESGLSTTLPVEDATSERKQPWLLHTLAVNALNFCSFTMCLEKPVEDVSNTALGSRVLIATPGVQDGYINITSFPSEARIATIPTPKSVNTGMIMAIGQCYISDELTVLAGYESGHVAIWRQKNTKHWETSYVSKAHTQPVLSLDIALQTDCFFTSSADAIVAQHPLSSNSNRSKTVQTRHAGQQSLKVRSDEKIFATAGWDGRVRVYSTKTMKELAVLKWHNEGCYAVAFADVFERLEANDSNPTSDERVVEHKPSVAERRSAKAQTTHWLAAGSKDGKVSLWDIY